MDVVVVVVVDESPVGTEITTVERVSEEEGELRWSDGSDVEAGESGVCLRLLMFGGRELRLFCAGAGDGEEELGS